MATYRSAGQFPRARIDGPDGSGVDCNLNCAWAVLLGNHEVRLSYPFSLFADKLL